MARINQAEPRRVILHRQLAVVLRDLGAGVHRIAKQYEIIAKLEAGGHDTTDALTELRAFKRVHAINVATHRLIMRHLGAADQVSHLHHRRPRRTRLRARKVYRTHRTG